MSKGSVIAKNYAKALFKASSGGDNLDKINLELKNFRQNFSANFVVELQNPAISKKSLAKICAEISQKFAFSSVTANFFAAIAKNRRLNLLSEICAEFNKIVEMQNNILEIEIITANKAKKSEIEALQNIISQKYPNKKIAVKETIKDEILGGFQIKIDSKLIDASLQSQIAAIGKSLLAIN